MASLVINVAVTCANGSVAIMAIVINDGRGLVVRTATAATIEGDIVKSSAQWDSPPLRVGGALQWRIIQPADVAGLDRTYRNSWVDQGGFIVHDMPRARLGHQARIRAARRARFEAFDTEFTRRHGLAIIARNAGQTAVAATHETAMETIEGQRQQLRDAPQAPGIDAATTIAALKAVWPAILNG